MDVAIVRRIPFTDLESKLKQVELLKPDSEGNKIYPYKDSEIIFRQAHPDSLVPTTLYLLNENLTVQKELREVMLTKFGIDSLQLDAAYTLDFIQGSENQRITILPPIVENQPESVSYDKHSPDDLPYVRSKHIIMPYLNDGAHRIWLSKELGINPVIADINNVHPKYPLYAHGNSWDDVKLMDEVPSPDQKKLYRRKGDRLYQLYRNFDSVFEGCSKPRTKVE
tara:strand:- start:15442 stop:16113 length:672 start_codon:yes stop_codon:yes gene_type:complete